jgi:hypothetical protein
MIKLIKLFIILSLFTNLTFAFAMSATSNETMPVYLAAGANSLLAASKYPDTVWKLNNIPYLQDAVFNAASCASDTTNSLCLLTATSTVSQPPILFASTNRMKTWQWLKIPGLDATASFTAVSCSGNGAQTICAAAGTYFSFGQTTSPFLIASIDHGKNWQVTLYPYPPTQISKIEKITCTGGGAAAVCMAVGDSDIFVTRNGGARWEQQSLNLPYVFTYKTVHCNNTICIAAGYSQPETTNVPFIVISQDRGITWNTKAIDNYEGAGEFKDAYCTIDGSQGMCYAVGSGENDLPLIAVSTDGQHWTLKPIPDLPARGKFKSIYCTGSSSNDTCVASGIDDEHNTPLLIMSNDGGNTWAVKPFSIPGIFTSTRCSKNNTNTVCLASGFGNSKPLLAVSTDRNTWKLISIDMSGNGSFNTLASLSDV